MTDLKRLFLTYILVLTAMLSQAQFFNRVDWRLNRHQLELGLGASNFLGDLGGKDAIGTNDFQDLELPLTNFGIMIGYKYALYRKLHLRTNITYGTLKGDDKLTKEPFRENRNLNFRSRLWEFSALLEYEIPLNLRKGHIYDIKGVKGWKNGGSSLYVFVGLAAFHYNPKAYLDGEWIALRPLRTEGQGLPGGPKEYKKWALGIPVGLALSKRVGRRISLSLEANYRFTNTDYIDDVSTKYYNPYELSLYVEDGYEQIAAYLSNPALGPAQGGLYNRVTATGQQRGDVKDDDGYMFLLLKMQYLLERNQEASKIRKTTNKRGKPGRRIVF